MASSLRSAEYLENVKPGTAANLSYKSCKYILLLSRVRLARYVADNSNADEEMLVAPTDAKLMLPTALQLVLVVILYLVFQNHSINIRNKLPFKITNFFTFYFIDNPFKWQPFAN